MYRSTSSMKHNHILLALCILWSFSQPLLAMSTQQIFRLKNEAEAKIRTLKAAVDEGNTQTATKLKSDITNIIKTLEPASSGSANQLRKSFLAVLETQEATQEKREQLTVEEKSPDELKEAIKALSDYSSLLTLLLGKPNAADAYPMPNTIDYTSYETLFGKLRLDMYNLLARMYPISANQDSSLANQSLKLLVLPQNTPDGNGLKTFGALAANNKGGVLFWVDEFTSKVNAQMKALANHKLQNSALSGLAQLDRVVYSLLKQMYMVNDNAAEKQIKQDSDTDLILPKIDTNNDLELFTAITNYSGMGSILAKVSDDLSGYLVLVRGLCDKTSLNLAVKETLLPLFSFFYVPTTEQTSLPFATITQVTTQLDDTLTLVGKETFFNKQNSPSNFADIKDSIEQYKKEAEAYGKIKDMMETYGRQARGFGASLLWNNWLKDKTNDTVFEDMIYNKQSDSAPQKLITDIFNLIEQTTPYS